MFFLTTDVATLVSSRARRAISSRVFRDSAEVPLSLWKGFARTRGSPHESRTGVPAADLQGVRIGVVGTRRRLSSDATAQRRGRTEARAQTAIAPPSRSEIRFSPEVELSVFPSGETRARHHDAIARGARAAVQRAVQQPQPERARARGRRAPAVLHEPGVHTAVQGTYAESHEVVFLRACPPIQQHATVGRSSRGRGGRDRGVRSALRAELETRARRTRSGPASRKRFRLLTARLLTRACVEPESGRLRLESANEAHKLFFLTRLLKTLPSVDENPPPSCRSLRL